MIDMTDEMLPGMRIRHVAEALVRHAPARATVNGVTLRARYATTQARDLVDHYWHRMGYAKPPPDEVQDRAQRRSVSAMLRRQERARQRFYATGKHPWER